MVFALHILSVGQKLCKIAKRCQLSCFILSERDVSLNKQVPILIYDKCNTWRTIVTPNDVQLALPIIYNTLQGYNESLLLHS